MLDVVEQYDRQQIPVLGSQRRIACRGGSVHVCGRQLESEFVGKAREQGRGLLAQTAPGARQQLDPVLIPRSLRSCPPVLIPRSLLAHATQYPVPYC